MRLLTVPGDDPGQDHEVQVGAGRRRTGQDVIGSQGGREEHGAGEDVEDVHPYGPMHVGISFSEVPRDVRAVGLRPVPSAGAVRRGPLRAIGGRGRRRWREGGARDFPPQLQHALHELFPVSLYQDDLSLVPLSGAAKLRGAQACCVNENPRTDDPFAVQVSSFCFLGKIGRIVLLGPRKKRRA